MGTFKHTLIDAIVHLPTIPPHSWTGRYPHVGRIGNWKARAFGKKLLSRTGHKVFGGPFSCMRLVPGSQLAENFPAIVGSYEKDIHDVIQKVISKCPKRMIDIGSAYGLYTVGMGMHMPRTEIIAFEGEPQGHWEEAAALAKLNGVTNITQEGFCRPADLKRYCTPESFILCDCEGGEKDLMDPVAIPELKSCFILCELHDFYAPGVTALLVERFQETHHIEIRSESARNPDDYRILRGLHESLRKVAVLETRFVADDLVFGRNMILTPKSSQFWS